MPMNPDSRSVGRQSVREVLDFGFRRIYRGSIEGAIIVPACSHACLTLPTTSCKLLKIQFIATFESYSAHHLLTVRLGDMGYRMYRSMGNTFRLNGFSSGSKTLVSKSK